MALTETNGDMLAPLDRNMMITHVQKQRLIDDMQLEITRRARDLRAHYGQMAMSLRGRLESRANRIPRPLRKRVLQDLLDEHAEQASRPPAPSVAVIETTKPAAPPRSTISRKRTSDEISEDDDDEAEDKENNQKAVLELPKKRTKMVPKVELQPHLASTILSPKSNNSRTFSRQAGAQKRAPAKNKINVIADSSDAVSASDVSLKKPVAKRPTTATKRTTASKTTAKKQPAATKKENLPPAGRALRKRAN
ncbi:hypothetical protein K470DRAFT_233916 [Piedraia hortae CBS 480.64]|uniref:Borealin N-terminal domain-containing protein n=1 Tax=Piedraia hortae CBS 480.64 TaxID=1314780 RepID=A0A6A7BW81_9PEZI|nr:hypothetical protein K470DRAFT_233916 [Piedraia hortae CBS 480.64]